MIRLLTATAFATAMTAALTMSPALAENLGATVVIKDHVFDPMEIKVPAGATVELTIDNRDPTPEEFESADLGVEKVIPGNSSGKVRFGPLEAGTYLFIGEFNQRTARGVVTAE
jgi:plastocyanin domain-containing protein